MVLQSIFIFKIINASTQVFAIFATTKCRQKSAVVHGDNQESYTKICGVIIGMIVSEVR